MMDQNVKEYQQMKESPARQSRERFKSIAAPGGKGKKKKKKKQKSANRRLDDGLILEEQAYDPAEQQVVGAFKQILLRDKPRNEKLEQTGEWNMTLKKPVDPS